MTDPVASPAAERVRPARQLDVGLVVVFGAFAAMLVVLLVIDSTKFWQSSIVGFAIGGVYALVCLGFVVIYRATGLLNFAQVGLVTLGAFLAFNAVVTWGLSWWIAIVISAIGCALAGYLFQRFVLQIMVAAPLFSKILATVGAFLFLQALVEWIWGADAATGGVIENPFGIDKFAVGPTSMLQVDAASLALAVVLMVGFFVLFEYTRAGLAMRATAIDPEAALAQGVNVNGVVALSWIIAGVTAAVAGTMLGSNASPQVGLNATMIALVALRAFPAMVLGGLDSPLGALLGGLMIGLLEAYALAYVPVENVGQFAAVLPYLVMIAVLLIRPFGLFGSRDVRRI